MGSETYSTHTAHNARGKQLDKRQATWALGHSAPHTHTAAAHTRTHRHVTEQMKVIREEYRCHAESDKGLHTAPMRTDTLLPKGCVHVIV